MASLCEWAIQCGNDVVSVVKAMESRGKVVATSFKVIEQFRDPSDYRELASVVLSDTSKHSVSGFKLAAQEILNRRFWLWILCHPQLGPEYIHPTRSMSSPARSCLLVSRGDCVLSPWQNSN